MFRVRVRVRVKVKVKVRVRVRVRVRVFRSTSRIMYDQGRFTHDL